MSKSTALHPRTVFTSAACARVWLAAAFVAVACLLTGCGQAPQLENEEALSVADSLWTAVTAKRTDLLEMSGEEIEALHGEAKINDAAHAALIAIVATARQGQWTDARLALKTLVRGQRPAKPH